MIKSIRLTNFFSFQDETIDFHPEANVMVGVNGSGKSNLIKAIQLLKTGVEGNARGTALQDLIIGKWGGFDNVFWKGKREKEWEDSIGLEFTFDRRYLFLFGVHRFDADVRYRIEISRKAGTDNFIVYERISTGGRDLLIFNYGGGWIYPVKEEQNGSVEALDGLDVSELVLSRISDLDKDRYPHLVQIKKAILDISVYNYFDTSENSTIRRAMSATSSARKLWPDGGNLPQILNTINIKDKKRYKKVLEKLKEVNEYFSGLDFHVLGSGTFELMLEERELNSSIHITHVSDGTLRYLCLLAILLNPERGRFICIDEPEVGLHPDMIRGITSLLQEVANETTFLIATHSDNVVNSFRVEQVRVFEKDETNSTVVKQYSEADFAGWYDEFNPGAMWRAGDLGGNRY